MITEKKVSETLREIGMPCTSGFEYAKKAVLLITSGESQYRQITKVLYPTVSDMFETTPSRVERAIRHAITRTFDYGSPLVHGKIFGSGYNPQKGKPTNREFLFALAEYLKYCEE